jgi:sulfoxide reductase heme-binding subunit YedZ
VNISARYRFLYKPAVFIACAIPALLMALAVVGIGPMDLGADPARRIIHACGITALNLLLITLSITPVRKLAGMNSLLRLRRMLGVFAFAYALLHFSAYFWLDQQLDLRAIGADLVKRPYITVGMAALVMLIPLAVTSTNGMMRRLGRNWQKLHRLAYVVTAFGIWHFYWQVKKDIREPLIYLAIFLVLMGWRLRAKFVPARAQEST